MNLKRALATLDTANDDHWTADGLPRVDAVGAAMRREVKRREITDAAPSLTRETFASEFPPVGHEPDAPDPKEPEVAPPAPTPEVAPDTTPETEETPTADPVEADPETPEVPPVSSPENAPDVEPEMTPEESAHVELHDKVVAMDVRPVVRDIDLVDRAIDEFGRQASVLTARREAIIAKLKEVGQRSAMLSRARNMLLRAGAVPTTTSPIQDYLKVQQQSRAARAERAQKFIEAGTTAKEVAAQLAGPSKIDDAMAAKRKRGAQRPAYPVTAGQ